MVWPYIAAAANIASGIGGMLGDKKAAEEAEKRYKTSKGLLLRGAAESTVNWNKAGDLLQQNLAGVKKGFGNARSALSSFGTSARQGALTQQNQALSSIAQNMASRGLGGTTVLDNANRGIYSDTSRRLAEIDEAQGSLMSQLAIGESQAAGAARANLADFWTRRDAAATANRTDLINLILGTTPQAQNPLAWVGGAGTSLAQLFG